jgi:hypothetical protein
MSFASCFRLVVFSQSIRIDYFEPPRFISLRCTSKPNGTGKVGSIGFNARGYSVKVGYIKYAYGLDGIYCMVFNREVASETVYVSFKSSKENFYDDAGPTPLLPLVRIENGEAAHQLRECLLRWNYPLRVTQSASLQEPE